MPTHILPWVTRITLDPRLPIRQAMEAEIAELRAALRNRIPAATVVDVSTTEGVATVTLPCDHPMAQTIIIGTSLYL